MNIVERAFCLLYPEKEINYNACIKYSRKFNDYNANVRARGDNLVFNLSRKWKDVDADIRIGLIQELLVKIVKDKRSTINMDLYHKFVQNLHVSVPKENVDEQLLKSFERVNTNYFDGMVEMPNLVFGGRTMSKLGHYNYHTDTIEISSVFRNADIVLLDMIMHHEILHKKLKFFSTPGRSRYHTTEFRQKEKEFENYDEAENKLRMFLMKSRVKSWFWG